MRMPLTSTPTKRRWWPGPGSGVSGGELAKETTPNVGRGASGANGADGTRTGNGAIGAIGVGSGSGAGAGSGTGTGDAASGAGTGTGDEAIGTGTGGCSDTGTGTGDESREAAAPSADGTPHRCEGQKSDFGQGRAQTRRKRKMTGTRTAQTKKKKMLLQGCGDRLENPNDVAPRSTSRSKRMLARGHALRRTAVGAVPGLVSGRGAEIANYQAVRHVGQVLT